MPEGVYFSRFFTVCGATDSGALPSTPPRHRPRDGNGAQRDEQRPDMAREERRRPLREQRSSTRSFSRHPSAIATSVALRARPQLAVWSRLLCALPLGHDKQGSKPAVSGMSPIPRTANDHATQQAAATYGDDELVVNPPTPCQICKHPPAPK